MSEKRSTVVISRAAFIKSFKRLAAVVNKQKKFYKDLTVLELTVTDGVLALAVPGAVLRIEGTTSGTCKATIRYFYFLQMIEDSAHRTIEIEITQGEININGVRKNISTTFFENDSILRTINLPANYRIIDLLRLPSEGFTIEELQFNVLDILLQNAKMMLKGNIERSYSNLSDYGVTKEDIIELVEKRGRIKIDFTN